MIFVKKFFVTILAAMVKPRIAVLARGVATVISGVRKRVVSKRVVLADVSPERKPERGYVRQNHPFGVDKRVVSKRVVSADVPQERKPERGHVRQNHPFTKPPFYLPVIIHCACICYAK